MTKQLQNISVARVATVPFFILTQLGNQIEAIKEAGAFVSVISSDKGKDEDFDLSSSCDFIPIYIPREINIKQDLVALFKLWNLFRTRRFDIVHSVTPKAGLLCAIAAKMAGIPIRLHTFTGQPWVTLQGAKRRVVKFCDKIIGIFNTSCYADSFSQQTYLIQERVISQNKLSVLGNGSLAGVNLQRFSASRFSDVEKSDIKSALGIQGNPVIILFVGRITQDKGIFELVDAFEQLIKKGTNAVLLLVGPSELALETNFEEDVRNRCSDKVIFTGFSDQPEKYMAIANMLCLPSYREGFGTVVIEAAAMGIPVVATKIYGLTDAVVDGVTGILVEPKNSLQLADALECLITNNQLREQMGEDAKKRAVTDFDSTHCNALLVEEYKKLLSKS